MKLVESRLIDTVALTMLKVTDRTVTIIGEDETDEEKERRLMAMMRLEAKQLLITLGVLGPDEPEKV